MPNLLIRLIPSRDVILIVSSMIEGMCQLLWAAEAPETRPFQWRAFAYVHDWRVMQEQVAQGETVSPERRKDIESKLQEYGNQYLKNQARNAFNRGDSLLDKPYYANWRCGTSISEMCKTIGQENLYQKLYEPFSDWQHWGVGGLGKL